jgi:hypothetical protein
MNHHNFKERSDAKRFVSLQKAENKARENAIKAQEKARIAHEAAERAREEHNERQRQLNEYQANFQAWKKGIKWATEAKARAKIAQAANENRFNPEPNNWGTPVVRSRKIRNNYVPPLGSYTKTYMLHENGLNQYGGKKKKSTSTKAKKSVKRTSSTKGKKSVKRTSSTKGKKRSMRGGGGSDWLNTVNSRGNVAGPNDHWGVGGAKWSNQFEKSGEYISMSELRRGGYQLQESAAQAPKVPNGLYADASVRGQFGSGADLGTQRA